MKTADESSGGWLRWVSLPVLLLREEGAAAREGVLVTGGCGGEAEVEGPVVVAPACWGESEKWQGRPVCRRKIIRGGSLG